MTSPAPEGAPPINHWWTAQPGDVRRLSGALTRAGLVERRQIVPLIVFLVVVLGAVTLLFLSGQTTFATGGIAGLAGAVGVLVRRTLGAARKHFERIAFPGAQWAIGYGPTSLVLYQPTASAVIDYSRFTYPRPGHGNTVLLRYADSRLVVVLPDALCPPAALDFLDTAIRGRRPS